MLGANRGSDVNDADDRCVAVSNKEQPVSKENCIYGRRWNSIHNGYFSDPLVVFPLIGVIKRVIEECRPGVVADFGGGTGFVLKELLRHQMLSGVRLVNVDSSSLQLSECLDDRIVYLQDSVDRISRSQLEADETGLMIVARSLLHYFGYLGLRPLLGHIRRQLRKGEFFVHQSACFENVRDAECLNLVYRLMSTQKWFTTVDNLRSILCEAGFDVIDVCPAAKIQVESDELSERYQLDSQQKKLIQKETERLYGQKPEVFISSANHFTLWLHYYIFTCKAT